MSRMVCAGSDQPEALGRPLVELRGILADCRLAALADLGQDRLDRLPHLQLLLRRRLGRTAFLDAPDHRRCSCRKM
jgi:hypothetical protein